MRLSCTRNAAGIRRLRIQGRQLQRWDENAVFPPVDVPVVMTRTFASWMLGLFFVAAGTNHFLNPAPYLSMMPPYLPNPHALNVISGAAEIAGGAGIIFRPTRVVAGWGLLVLLAAVFPANVNVALHGWKGENIAPWLLWARLPFQPLIMGLVYWACVARRSHPRAPN
jgi:uncharacterized membrane protein